MLSTVEPILVFGVFYRSPRLKADNYVVCLEAVNVDLLHLNNPVEDCVSAYEICQNIKDTTTVDRSSRHTEKNIPYIGA